MLTLHVPTRFVGEQWGEFYSLADLSCPHSGIPADREGAMLEVPINTSYGKGKVTGSPRFYLEVTHTPNVHILCLILKAWGKHNSSVGRESAGRDTKYRCAI